MSIRHNAFGTLRALSALVGFVFCFSACNKEVNQEVPVESITIDQGDFTMAEGGSRALTATVLPENATDKKVSWSSSNDDVVVITNTDKAVAMAMGESVITARAGDKSASITITVIKPVPVTGVSLDNTTLELKVEESETLTATITPGNATNKNVFWTSSDPTVATVENGRVTGVRPGSATITVRTEDGDKTDECAVTIKTNLPPSVTVGAENVSAESVVLKGEANLDAPLSSGVKMGIMWAESVGDQPSDFTKVEASNMEPKEGQPTYYSYSVGLTGLSPTSRYWYMSYLEIGGQIFFGELKDFSTGVQPVTGVSLDKTACTVHTIDSTFTLTPTVLPEDATNKAVRWESSNPSVATVDENGQVTAKGNGSATITVTTEDQGKTATCEVTVAQWVTGIVLDQTTLTLNEGQTATVSVTSITPDNADDKSVTWTSDNPSVATVDQEGKVTAVSGGKANIIVTANDGSGKSASCSVTVGVPVTGVSLNYTEYGFTTIWGSVLQLEATVSPFNATDKSVSWKTSDPSVATVDQNGMVYVQGYGEATITVTTNDGGKTATCVIYVSQKVMSITLDKTFILLLEGEETTISVKSIFPDVADKSYTWSSTDPAVASVDENGKISAKAKGTTTIKATANDGGGAYGSCSVQVSDGTVATPEAVDLGLSVKWGSFNLGASAPQERGWYYAWGEILDKTSFSWSNYKWCNGTMDSITKYTSTTHTTHGDGRLSLEIEDDVARTKLGVYWRMPWKSEWEELMRDCTWEWTQQSGVYGFKVTGKKPGYTNNSIFLPAAGYWDENGYRSGSTYVVGYYWSHRLALNTYDAYSFECGHSYADNQNTITSDTNIMRCYGVSIRPVLPE